VEVEIGEDIDAKIRKFHPSNGTVAPDGSKGREASDETVIISNFVLKIFVTRVQFIQLPSNNDLASFKCAVISGVPMEHNANEEMTALKYRRR